MARKASWTASSASCSLGKNLPGHVEHEPLIPGRQGSKLALFLRALHHGQGQG